MDEEDDGSIEDTARHSIDRGYREGRTVDLDTNEATVERRYRQLIWSRGNLVDLALARCPCLNGLS